MRKRILGLALVLAATLLPLPARAEELTRIEQIREQIKATETLLDQATRSNEKATLQTRLDRLHRELENQEQRLRLEAKEQELEKSRSATPQSALGELLRRIDLSADHIKEGLTRNETELRQLEAQRDQLVEQRTAIRTDNEKSAAQASELDERILNAREGIEALALEHEALTEELHLAQEVDRIQEEMKIAKAKPIPAMNDLLDARGELRQRGKQTIEENSKLETLAEKRAGRAAEYELARQKFAQIDEEISLLEKQTGIFNSNAQISRLLNTARSQKKYLDQRLAFFGRELAAIERSIAAVTKTADIQTREAAWLGVNYEELKSRYLRRLATPTVILSALLVLFIVVSRVVLPMVRSRENLLLSRRLARYMFVLAAAAVIAGYFFDDLQGVLTVLGIVSAALVIALQDVCASMAGWFVIIAGAKFRIGDRVEIDGDRGDVLDIELLRTTILEVGKGIGAEHPTGRIIVLPNSFVLKSKVFNATHGHPFVWCRQVFTFTNESPYRDVEATVHRVIAEETATDFEEARRAAQNMEKRYGVSDAEYKPKIYVRLADWGVEFSCLHVCHFRKVNETQSRIHERMARELAHDPRLVTAYPTQRQVTGFEQLTIPELSRGPAVSAVASMPAGGVATVTVSDHADNGHHAPDAVVRSTSTGERAAK